MWQVEEVWEDRNKTPVLLASGGIALAIAVADWWTMPYVSLGFFYLFPIMLAAEFLPRWSIALLGLGCAIFSELLSPLDRSLIRLSFETLALGGCGLFVAELVLNRKLTLKGRERLKALVETSPAAIMTVDDHGVIELSNHAAIELMAPRDGKLNGSPIAAYLPGLHHALRWEDAPQFRASMQCRGHKANGETFTAEIWFSTYKEGSEPKLAAIIADVTEGAAAGPPNLSQSNHLDRRPLNDREMSVLRLLAQGFSNKDIAVRMEVSASTVKNTIQALFVKTNGRTRAQLIRVAFEEYRELL